jgi:beta-lactamase regulating signal transducer with metallopeptidase domain
MPTDLFYWLLNMSLTASAVGLVLLLVRRIARIPRFAVYSLWALVLIRLVVPVSVAYRFSLMNLVAGLTSPTVVPVGDVTMTNMIQAASSYGPIVFRTQALAQVFAVASVVWLAGAVLAWAAMVSLYVAAGRQLRGAEHVAGDLYRSARVDTPCVVGILRPRIVVPPGMVGDALAWALRHEQVHLRRRDNVTRAVSLAVCGLHWFNPLVWLFLRAFLQDMEAACDAGVLKGRPEPERRAYARALLDHAAPRSRLPVPAFGGGTVRRRIALLLAYRPYALLALLGFVALWIAIAVALLANPPL